MAPSKGPPVALLIHRRQRDVESCPYRPGCHVSHHLPNPPWQGLYDSFNWVTQQVDQTNAQAGFLQKIHGRPEIVVVFLFHSISCRGYTEERHLLFWPAVCTSTDKTLRLLPPHVPIGRSIPNQRCDLYQQETIMSSFEKVNIPNSNSVHVAPETAHQGL